MKNSNSTYYFYFKNFEIFKIYSENSLKLRKNEWKMSGKKLKVL